MKPRRLLRPLPLLIAFVFVAVAVGDLVQTLRREPPAPPTVLRPGSVRFEPWSPVIDLRSGDPYPGIELRPQPVFAGPLWSARGTGGVWLLGDGAGLELDLTRGGQQLVIFDGRPAAGKRPVREVGVTVNDVDCGVTSLDPGWQRWTIRLPAGVLQPGSNHIVFSLPDRAAQRQPRRALQLRRIELRLEETADSGRMGSEPLTIDFGAQKLVVRTPGILEARFSVDDRVDALRMIYRFSGPGGSGEMTLARPQGGGVGRDAPVHSALAPSERGVRRVRIPLHGRRGEFFFVLEVEPGSGPSRLDVRSLELVTEASRPAPEGGRPG